MREMPKENRRFDWIMTITGVLTIGLGIAIVILLYRAGRSLWLDESLLAYSINKRSLLELAASVLDRNQSAPILYLYAVKIITLFFGNSEFMLRILSFACYLGMLSCAYYLLSRVYRLSWPLLGVGFIATMKLLLYYANELKPYMSDCFLILLVLVLYDFHKKDHLSQIGFVVVSMILVWASSPVIFFLGAIYIYELLVGIRGKDKVVIRNTVIGGGVVLLSFLVNYWYWLRPVAQSAFMLKYWEDSTFPLFVKSIEDIKRIIVLVGEFSTPFTFTTPLLLCLSLIGATVSVLRKDRHTLIILFGILLTLIASAMGKYPFNSRLVLFLYPLLGIFVFIGLEVLASKMGGARKSILAFLVVAIMLSNYASIGFLEQDNRYRQRFEINSLVDYIKQEIEVDENLYVHVSASAAFLYRNNYDTNHVGEFIDEGLSNVIIGKRWNMNSKGGEAEVKSLLDEERLYLLFTPLKPTLSGKLIPPLNKSGYVELIKEAHGTRLYYYSKSAEDVKSSARLNLVEQKIDDQEVCLTFDIEAGPDAYLQHDQGQTIILADKKVPDLEFEVEKRQIAPGESFRQTVSFIWPSDQDELSFSLRSESFWFDELGTEPVVISRENL